MLVVIFGISAVYAYKKIKDYLELVRKLPKLSKTDITTPDVLIEKMVNIINENDGLAGASRSLHYNGLFAILFCSEVEQIYNSFFLELKEFNI